MSRRTGARVALFTALVIVCAVVGVGYVLRARTNDPHNGLPTLPTVPANVADLPALMARPHLVFRNTDLGSAYGKLEVVPLADPSGARVVTPLTCDRVTMAADVGICLAINQGVITTYKGEIFDSAFRITHDFPLLGLPSRVRVSPDGKVAAMTVFVHGDSYASQNFSTRTTFVDTRTGASLGNLEQFRVTSAGNEVTAISRNYWGVTFASDSNHFYATLAVGTDIHLIEGDLQQHTAHAIASGAECPSLSPDQTRVAYKKRVGGQLSAVRWRLHVLDLKSGLDKELADTRSVDDQVEWLDNATVLYALPRSGAGSIANDTWAEAADGSGTPRIYVRGATSPSVVT